MASHDVPRNAAVNTAEGAITPTFSDFISASAQLESTYRDLHAQLAALHLRLLHQDQELRESASENDRLAAVMRSTLECLPCGVLVVDGARVHWANPEAARLLALLAAQLPTAATRDDAPHFDQWLQHAAESATAEALEQEWSFRSAAGQHWLAGRYVVLPGKTDVRTQTRRALVILEDHTLRRGLEQERAAARDNEALGKITSLLAHEIRNPLASMELFAGLLQDDPDRQAEWLSHMRAGIRSLSGTVNNVLALNGSATLAIVPLELNAEVAAATRFLQPLATQANVRLQMAAAPVAIKVWANKDAVHQILLNLVGNALRFVPGAGTILLSCSLDERSACLRVIDSGPGIANEEQIRIFESGFSGAGTRPGLGLTVCRTLMQQQGGAIYVQSTLGKGATFVLEFRRV